jgi:SagB-type dehydrogenase family enzyme
MTAGQLGEFLFRVARVREVISHEILTPAGPMTMDIAPRPYPAGGALYELEVYAVVQACAGVGPGIYYYDPCGHRLARLRGPTDEYGLLLEDAALCAGVDPATLQVLLVSSARFPRVSWKYSGLAYSLVLKHVGIVQQSMYLVATSMGLGGCALGAGDSDLFARAVGTDYYAETSVGEFLLGSVPRGRSVPARGLVAGAAEPNGPTDPARPAPW